MVGGFFVRGMEMKVKDEPIVQFRGICDSCGQKLVEVTRRIEVDGKYYFFCCDICVWDFIHPVWVEVADPFFKPDWQKPE